MDRRQFLSSALAAAAGIGIGFGLDRGHEEEQDRVRIERTDAAGPAVEAEVGLHRIIWSVPTTADRSIALTFDDGPDPEFTPRILEVLGRYGITATFNVMGFNVERHPDVARAVVAGGHELGNHTLTHRDLAFESAAATRSQISGATAAIREVTSAPVRYFRPPRGELTGVAARVAGRLGYDILLWSVSGGEPGREQPADVGAHLLAHLHSGAIVALHDGIGRGTFNPDGQQAQFLRERRTAELEALPRVIETALERGYRLGSVSALLASARGGDGGAASEG